MDNLVCVRAIARLMTNEEAAIANNWAGLARLNRWEIREIQQLNVGLRVF